jgi:hypothetical protein
MTIGEYAEKWAVVENRALEKISNPPSNRKSGFCSVNPLQYEFRSWRLEIFYEWAKDDKDSPIAEALRNGVPNDEVFGEFENAYSDMLAILHKFR